MTQVKVLVIGGGPGGYVAAIRLGQLGQAPLVVDRLPNLGGECLNWGCIPSKAFIASANIVHKLKKAEAVGITAENVRVDFAKLVNWKGQMVGGLGKGIAQLFKSAGVSYKQGTAKLTGPNRAVVTTAEGEEEVSFERCILATGSSTLELPGFAIDGKNVIGSKEALSLDAVPPRLAVIGGGVIGLEMGTFFAKLGSQVTVIELMEQLLPGVDADLAAPVARSLQKLGVTVHLKAKAKGWESTEAGLALKVETAEGEATVSADKILLSVGRAPNTKDLGLEAAGVKVSARGFIQTDASFKTTAEGIYAIGDVTGPPYLAHRASRQGVLAAESIASGRPAGELGPVPGAIFTDPEVAVVGDSEDQLKAAGVEYTVGKFPFAALGRAQAYREADGFVKILAEKSSGRLLGAAIVGSGASDVISEATLAIRLGATVSDLSETIHPHPTLPEALGEAAEAVEGKAIHVAARKKAEV